MRLSNTEFALLSLLAESPSHDYAIEQTIEARGMRNWTESWRDAAWPRLRKRRTGGRRGPIA